MLLGEEQLVTELVLGKVQLISLRRNIMFMMMMMTMSMIHLRVTAVTRQLMKRMAVIQVRLELTL